MKNALLILISLGILLMGCSFSDPFRFTRNSEHHTIEHWYKKDMSIKQREVDIADCLERVSDEGRKTKYEAYTKCMEEKGYALEYDEVF